MQARKEQLRHRNYALLWCCCLLLSILGAVGGALASAQVLELRWGVGLFRALVNLVPLSIGGLLGFFLVHTVSWALFCAPGYERFLRELCAETLARALREVFSDVRYAPEKGLPRKLLERTNMLRRGNRFESSDVAEAVYHDLGYRQAQVTWGYFCPASRSRSACRELWFSGRWMIFDLFPTDDPFYLYLRDKAHPVSAQAREGFYEEQPDVVRVKMEDASLNAEFDIFAGEAAAARRFLTPTVVRLLRSLRDSVDGRLLLCLADGRLHIAVEGLDTTVEPPLFSKLNLEADVKAAADTLRVYTAFAENLKAEL